MIGTLKISLRLSGVRFVSYMTVSSLTRKLATLPVKLASSRRSGVPPVSETTNSCASFGYTILPSSVKWRLKKEKLPLTAVSSKVAVPPLLGIAYRLSAVSM
ncbi:hypothetical protein HC891_21900 [Candidatus Gracilibacteria bacterium]|nr:hypothetical protein [Candidatus Gracilibacteria bacterium]